MNLDIFNCKCISNLKYLEINDDLKLMKTLNLKSNKEKTINLEGLNFYTKLDVLDGIGNIGFEDNPYISGQWILFNPSNKDIVNIETEIGYFINIFLIALWFIKDNSVNAGNYMILLESDLGYKSPKYSKYNNIVFYYNNSGKIENTYFNINELNDAAIILNILLQKLIIKSSIGLVKSDEIKDKIFTNDNFYIAYNLLLKARSEKNLYTKILNYIKILETFFLNNSEYKSKQIINRVLSFINDEDVNGMEVSDIILNSYSICSSYEKEVYDNDLKKLNEISINLDELVRKVFRGFINEFELLEKSDDSYSNWLDNLFFL